MNTVTKTVKSIFSVKGLKKRLPIFEWLPKYNSECLLGDTIAGITVGLTVIPQGIAYALIAGLPANYGLYSSFMGAIVYVFFGSCKDITIGPTAIMSILTATYCKENADIANLLCLISGIIILLCGCFNLGFLIAFVSKPVISGFTSAAAIIIASSQLKPLFGVKMHAHGLVDTYVQLFKHITETRLADFGLGVMCIIILLLMRKLKDIERFKRSPHDQGKAKAIKMTVFLTSVGRNAIIVIVATALAAALNGPNGADQPFIITGDIVAGLPEVGIPPFNTTLNGTALDFQGIMAEVSSGIIILPIIAILENIAIGSAFSRGKTLDATQEMIALGLCNICGSFFQSMPTTGSFSRTAVNATSGVKTPAGGIATAVLVILALAILTPYFKYIPKSALAAVIICAVIFSIEVHDIKPIWKVRKIDHLVWWSTFLACLFYELEYGIIIGVGVNLCILLSGSARPKIRKTVIVESDVTPGYVLIEPRTGLVYVNIDKIRNFTTKCSLVETKSIHPIVMDCRHYTTVDYSGCKGIQAMLKEFSSREQQIFFINCSPGVKRSLESINPDIEIIEESQLLEVLKKAAAEKQKGEEEKLTSPEQNENSRLSPLDAVETAIRRVSGNFDLEAQESLINDKEPPITIA